MNAPYFIQSFFIDRYSVHFQFFTEAKLEGFHCENNLWAQIHPWAEFETEKGDIREYSSA